MPPKLNGTHEEENFQGSKKTIPMHNSDSFSSGNHMAKPPGRVLRSNPQVFSVPELDFSKHV